MIKTQYIRLDMTPGGTPPVFFCSQYDVGRPLGMVVYNGDEAVDLSTYTCTIEATRTDGTAITAAVTTSGNIGAFVTSATMTNKMDKYPAKLVLFDSQSRRVASLAFVMCVTPATMDENAESITEDASLYQQYTGTVQTLIAEIREDIVDINTHISDMYFDTCTEMKANTTLKAGMIVQTAGYYAVNDGGAALYRIRNTAPSTHYETLANGLYAELVVNEAVTVEMFGAKGDGSTNDYSAINAALNSGNPVYLLPKVYKVSSPLTISKPVIVSGTSSQRLKTNRPQIDFSAISGDAITLSAPGVVFNDVNFIGNRTNTNLFSMTNVSRLTCNRCGIYEFNIGLKTDRAWNTGWNNCVFEFCNQCCEFDGINTSHVFVGCNFYSSTYGIHSKRELDYSSCIGCGFDHVDTVAQLENSYANNLLFAGCGFEDYITGIYTIGDSQAIIINPTTVNTDRTVETYKGAGHITVIGGRTDNALTPNKNDVLYIGTVLNANASVINNPFALNLKHMTPIGTGGIYDFIYPVSANSYIKINFTQNTQFDVQLDVCSTEYPETYHFTKYSSIVAKTQGTPATFTYVITTNSDVKITFTKAAVIRVRGWFKYGGSIT